MSLGCHLLSSATRDVRARSIVATAVEQARDFWRHPSRRPGSPSIRDRRGADGGVQGAIARGVSVFARGVPALANLDPDLRHALRRAARDAARSRVIIYVNSGWRSREYQQQLLDQAVLKYGSKEEAVRWVATANTSSHVTGDAVDIGPSSAMVWLSKNGAEYGLCQIYSNEPWHYELRPRAAGDGCPARYADPAHDPKMQQ